LLQATIKTGANMNVVTRGILGAVRSPIRAGAIVIMLAISIGLIVAMLAAKSGVETNQ
jgi:protein-S-isoprenylcysteine O-methyltransferase Ste14